MRRPSGFTNWAGNQTCLPERIVAPTSAEEVAELVATAAAREGRVKVVGAGHSFTDTACTDGLLLRLDALDRVSDHDPDTGEITVGAGIRLDALNDVLDARGLALPNLGDIAVQSLAGATATGTHGTGLAFANLSTDIVGFELVTGTGEVRWCDAEHHPEVFRAGRVGIGALGVITRIRLRCVPAFRLHAAERVEDLAVPLGDWQAFVASADHAELFFWPGTDRCLTKRNRRTDEPARPASRLRHLVDKELVENGLLDLTLRGLRRFPGQRDRVLGAVTSAVSDRDLVDRSDRVFASPRRVRFTEMEYGIPLDAVPEATERVAAFATSLPRPPLMPVEVRCSAADDIPLSTGHGRTSGWVAVHEYRGVPHGEYFRGVEAIMDDYEGRPHWGKLHFQTHDVLRERYPEWDAFAAVRTETDPQGTFRNAYLDRVLGPI